MTLGFVTLVAASCMPEQRDHDTASLTPEEAKAALEAMLRSLPEDSTERRVLKTLDNVPIERIDSDCYGIGPWRVRIAEKEFFFEFIRTEPSPPLFYRKSGVFVQDAQGHWRAVATEVVQN